MHDGKEGRGFLGVAGSDNSPPFEPKECILDRVARLVDVFVVFALHDAVAFRRYDRVHLLGYGLRHNRIGVVALVGAQMLGAHRFDQCGCLRAIRRGTVGNNDSERHTMHNHGQMYLAVEPVFASPIASLPPAEAAA